MKFKNFQTIRWRLLVGFVMMTLLPAVGITAISIFFEYENVETLVFDRMESIASQRQTQLETWVEAIHNEMLASLNENYALDRAQVLLNLANKDVYFETYMKSARIRLQRAVDLSTNGVMSYSYVDLDGDIVLSTDEQLEGKTLPETQSYDPMSSSFFVEFPFDKKPMMTVMPVYDWDNQFIGSLIAFVSSDNLFAILSNSSGLEKSGKVFLIDENKSIIVLNEAKEIPNENNPLQLPGSEMDAFLQNQIDGSGKYSDINGKNVLSVYHWLPTFGIGLVVEQDQSEAFQVISLIFRSNIIVAIVMIILAIGLALIITRSISDPITELVESTTRISSGDLSKLVKVRKPDEIGSLANAFNKMTLQLNDLINSLESKVLERTQEIQQRALQLETSARVSKRITSILDIDDLLQQVVSLIKDSFDYSQVNIYLLEKNQTYLLLQASSNGLDDQFQKIEIEHSCSLTMAIKNHQPILAHVTGNNNIASTEEKFFPEAESELIIPLQMGNKVIGALDIHQSKLESITQADIKLLQSLGDQIAIAIENARHYEQSQQLAVLEERNRLARDLHDSVTQSLYSIGLIIEGWRELLADGNDINTAEYLKRIGEINHQALGEMRVLISELKPPELEKQGLLRVLNNRLENVEKRAGIEARLISDGILRIPNIIEKELYWIALEALNNSFHHSEATSVQVRLSSNETFVIFEVFDNGKGFVEEEAFEKGGMGLIGMRERAQKIHSDFEIFTKQGQGTTIRVKIPKGAFG